MRCETAKSLIQRYVDGGLDGPQAIDLRNHLESCSECADEERLLREMSSILAVWDDIEPKRSFSELSAKIERGASQRSKWLQLPAIPLPRWASVVLAVSSVITGITFGVLTTDTSPNQTPTEQQVVSALDLHPHDDVVEASIVYAVQGGEVGSARGQEQ